MKPYFFHLIHSSHPQTKVSPKLLSFLKAKIGISDNAINLGLKHCEAEQAPLPIVLWSFGLLSIEQFQKVLDWQNDHL